MDDPGGIREGLIAKLSEKAALNQKVFDNTFSVFGRLKEVLHEMASEIDDALEEQDREAKIEYRDRGKFEAQIQIADDILIFSMHSNVFEFHRDHVIWQNPYVSGDRRNSYCGIINIYNFLSDSFRYNRSGDEGYLIGRIFVNREMRYFVEGKRQTAMRHGDFGLRTIDRGAILDIVGTAIDYTIDFDLLVPPYDAVKLVTVDQLNTKIENSKLQTGKRLGYAFDTDDI